MHCPMCRYVAPQEITNNGDKYYCIKCNYSWSVENECKEPKGDLSFSGIPLAKELFKLLTKDQEISPEMRAALESQMSAVIFDQWFEGFKAGQMASILYAKEHYGKDRNESRTTTGPCKNPVKRNQVGKNRITRRSQDPAANPGMGKKGRQPREGIETGGIDNLSWIKERVGEHGVELNYPRHLKISEDIYELITKMGSDLYPRVFYDGNCVSFTKGH